MSQTVDDWLDGHAKSLLRWRFIILSTMGLAAFSFGVGKSSGGFLWLSIVGGLLCAGLGGTIAWARDRVNRRDKERAAQAAATSAQEAKDGQDLAAQILATFMGAGLPLVITLGNICAGADKDARAVLVARVLDAARRRVGTKPVQNRAVFYRLVDSDTLVCDPTAWSGRERPPRRQRLQRTVEQSLGRTMLEFLSRDWPPFQDFPDVRERPPEGFGDPAEASYRSFLTVRVAAGTHRMGLLCVDSPVPGNFTDHDKDAMNLLAGMLGAGLAAAEVRACGKASTEGHAAGW
ncbi:hypothetical protein SAMN05660209_03034 [Geodermatophilus africanus]|uniref:GAF domain-containing protein n=1 Tax=Geodermatophilus africanus TaxID=1137993 RepID=A0A1H3KD19_9ACTN|nr:hypothetical protein [Geodermatophilus africanus]SDY50023.1 hypothetical protein SAMN05660209_03034 [Geodermatophilus africanus]